MNAESIRLLNDRVNELEKASPPGRMAAAIITKIQEELMKAWNEIHVLKRENLYLRAHLKGNSVGWLIAQGIKPAPKPAARDNDDDDDEKKEAVVEEKKA